MTHESSFPAVARSNEWKTLPAPKPDLVPSLSVSVVIPSYNSAHTLPLVLASLAAQDYPASLLEVVVVDDGGTPPIRDLQFKPENCRVVPVRNGDWGRANALLEGVLQTEGDVIHWLDSDMVLYRNHISAQAAWHTVTNNVVTIGHKYFLEQWEATPASTFRDVINGDIERWGGDTPRIKQWIEKIIEETDDLNSSGSKAYRVHVGASASLYREFLKDAGGLDRKLKRGEDTVLGYALAQAGAIFIPEQTSSAWHLGLTSMMQDGQMIKEFNLPYVAQRIPERTMSRNVAGRTWSIPLVWIEIPFDEKNILEIWSLINGLLAGTERDIHINIVGIDPELPEWGRHVFEDQVLRQKVEILEWFRNEPKVRFSKEVAQRNKLTPFVARFRPDTSVGKDSLHLMLLHMDKEDIGGLTAGFTHEEFVPSVSLMRVAALSRVQKLIPHEENLEIALEQVWGTQRVAGQEFGLGKQKELEVAANVNSSLVQDWMLPHTHDGSLHQLMERNQHKIQKQYENSQKKIINLEKKLQEMQEKLKKAKKKSKKRRKELEKMQAAIELRDNFS